MHKSQETGKGTGKWTGEGEKPPLPTPHHFVLISTLLIFGFKIKNGHCRKCRELFRPKNTPVYSRQSHDLWPPLTWPLPSSPPYYLVSPILLYFQKQRRRVKEKWKVFSPGKHAGMFSFARFSSSLLLPSSGWKILSPLTMILESLLSPVLTKNCRTLQSAIVLWRKKERGRRD